MIEKEITTMAGVHDAQDPVGAIRVDLLDPAKLTVQLGDGDNVLQLEVTDALGSKATVYLDWRMTIDLMVTLGASAANM